MTKYKRNKIIKWVKKFTKSQFDDFWIFHPEYRGPNMTKESFSEYCSGMAVIYYDLSFSMNGQEKSIIEKTVKEYSDELLKTIV